MTTALIFMGLFILGCLAFSIGATLVYATVKAIRDLHRGGDSK